MERKRVENKSDGVRKGTSWYDKDNRNKFWNLNYKGKDVKMSKGDANASGKRSTWSGKGGGWAYSSTNGKDYDGDDSNVSGKRSMWSGKGGGWSYSSADGKNDDGDDSGDKS